MGPGTAAVLGEGALGACARQPRNWHCGCHAMLELVASKVQLPVAAKPTCMTEPRALLPHLALPRWLWL